MRGENAQALIEAVIAFPICVLAAVTIIDCGIIARDRLATVQATNRAANALILSTPVETNALSALPASLRDDATVKVSANRITVNTTSKLRLISRATSIQHSSTAIWTSKEES